jgi:hypothetical protein
MTDVEYFLLSYLFEQKKLDKTQIQSLRVWLDHYHPDEEHWASPAELIEILEAYPDR